MSRKHPVRCEAANPKGYCACSCGGALHGILHDDKDSNLYIRSINEKLGGEVAKTILRFKGKLFKCTCGKKVTMWNFLGYPHDGGLVDGHGKKWWVFIECTKCKYQWSWSKIPVRLMA